MEALLTSKIKSLKDTLQFLAANKHLLEKDKGILRLLTRFETILAPIDSLIPKVEITTVFTTKEKKEIRKHLSDQIFKLVIIMIRIANYMKNRNLFKQTITTRSKLDYMREKEFINFCKKLICNIQTHESLLPQFRFNIRQVKTAEHLLLEFQQMILRPKKMVTERTKARKQLIDLKQRAEELLSEEMDWAMRSLELEMPELAQKYFNSRKYQKPRYWHAQLMGKVLDAQTGTPITKGVVLIKEFNRKTKITPTGRFTVKKILSGEFTLLVTAPNHKSRTIDLYRYPKQLMQITIELDPKIPQKEKASELN